MVGERDVITIEGLADKLEAVRRHAGAAAYLLSRTREPITGPEFTHAADPGA